MNTQKQIFLIVALFFVLTGGCVAYSVVELPYRVGVQEDYHREESIRRGALLFANNCRTCHGIQGEGGVGLQLNKDEFKDQSPLVLKANRDLIRQTIYCGRAGTRMPAWVNTLGLYPNERAVGGSLNLRQVDHLVDFITAALDPELLDENGNPTNRGWQEALEYAHNLNRETPALVSGDTLGSIATAHQIGAQELAALNNLTDVSAILKEGTKLQLPPNATYPNGRVYEVKKDNETVAKIAEAQSVGAVILAELNGLKYRLDKKSAAFTLRSEDGSRDVVGMFPGATLALPGGTTYAIRSGDTIQSIAALHGVTTGALRDANPQVLSSSVAADAKLESERRLSLPANAVAVVNKAGVTLASIATKHGLKLEDLVALNLDAGATLAAGQRIVLPANARVIVEAGDTLGTLAVAHGLANTAELASLNGLQPTEPIGPLVIINLPKVTAYVVQGQSLADVAKGYSSVTADSLAEANKSKNPDIKPNSILRIGTSLNLPADAWGSAPPETVNPGTACVEHAVTSDGLLILINGIVEPPARPVTTSKIIEIQANETDWTVVADGTAQEKNRGAVLIDVNTVIKFVNKVGLHTIDLNGEKEGDDFTVGQTRDRAFPTAGTFKITCEVHPQMAAWVYVQ